MNETPAWILTPVLVPLLLAFVLQGWGARLPRKGDWLAAIGLLS